MISVISRSPDHHSTFGSLLADHLGEVHLPDDPSRSRSLMIRDDFPSSTDVVHRLTQAHHWQDPNVLENGGFFRIARGQNDIPDPCLPHADYQRQHPAHFSECERRLPDAESRRHTDFRKAGVVLLGPQEQIDRRRGTGNPQAESGLPVLPSFPGLKQHSRAHGGIAAEFAPRHAQLCLCGAILRQHPQEAHLLHLRAAAHDGGGD